MSFADGVVVAAYALGVLAIGTFVARGHQSTADHWLGSRGIPTWAVFFSMVATELSAATFIGVPQAAYRSNWSYLQFAVGALLGKMLLASVVIPLYHRLGIVTVYGLLGERFGPRSRRAAALAFVCGRLLASGVRLFIAALALAVFAQLEVGTAIVASGIVAGVYTLYGGIRSVIYTDVLQGIVFMASALALLGVIALRTDGGAGEIYAWAMEGERLRILTLDPLIALADTRPLLVGVLGGLFLTLATHGTDHDMVQRLLAARDGRSGGRALLGSALLNFPLTALFLWIGTGIAFAYQSPPAYDIAQTSQILPTFALHELPSGLRGLLCAGILAAAMSSFDSAICAISTTWVVDVSPARGEEGEALRQSRRAAVTCCALLVGAALGMAAYHEAVASTPSADGGPAFNLVDLALSAMTILYGGLLGVFSLAIVSTTRGNDTTATCGLAVGAVTGALLFAHPLVLGEIWIGWPWWIPISASIALAVSASGRRRPLGDQTCAPSARVQSQPTAG